ncbi:sulfurtransferase FdhD [Nakamurella endophytica]|uniref:Sulfur carrier protein FdhD n=1 Tax=Nakamurella endophytica TaxID=1748367 RepID=A0A917WIN9_9ACTN|nr:sulfurtransferase FdhD [Nakamurella endophytica]
MRAPIRRWTGETFVSRPDSVAGEEPLELRVDGRQVTLTMRTPGHDLDLVHGFLHAEGVLVTAADVSVARYCDGVDDEGRQTYNVLDVSLSPEVPAERVADALSGAVRGFTTTSSCGVCGKSGIEALHVRMRHPLPVAAPVFDPRLLARLPDLLRARQQTFRRTGGLHAAALAAPDGTLSHVREDVGRHNAVDKVLGAALRAGELPAGGQALLTSSRASYELVQKALMAGIAVLVAVSAPSSLAVQLAAESGMTLVGFTRADGFNVYSAPERVAGAAG